MNCMSEKIMLDVSYLSSKSDKSFIKKINNLHLLSLQGNLSVLINNKIVAENAIAILELLIYCREWLDQNKNRRQVRNFVYMSIEHEEVIIDFSLDNQLQKSYFLRFFGGPVLTEVDSETLLRVIADLKNQLTIICLNSEIPPLQLSIFLGVNRTY